MRPSEIDEWITRANRGEMTYRALTKIVHKSASWISRRAFVLGLPYKVFKSVDRRTSLWKEAEIDLLAEHADEPVSLVSRLFAEHGYYRSPRAIECARTLHRKSGRIPPLGAVREEYTEGEVCEHLGVSKKKAKRWIDTKLLRMNPVGLSYRIKRSHLRSFMICYPHEWDHTKVDKYWMIDILANRRTRDWNNDRRPTN